MKLREAIVRKGQLVLKTPLSLPDGTPVRVRVEAEQDPLLFIADHAVDTGIPDLAEEHDHYIYGTPKR